MIYATNIYLYITEYYAVLAAKRCRRKFKFWKNKL